MCFRFLLEEQDKARLQKVEPASILEKPISEQERL